VFILDNSKEWEEIVQVSGGPRAKTEEVAITISNGKIAQT
jgi:hypothetical protein